MKQRIKFKVIERTKDDCEHDTGVFHSLGISCEDAERMSVVFAIRESDPDHQEIWHNPKNAIILEV
jgi:hypothetical protein